MNSFISKGLPMDTKSTTVNELNQLLAFLSTDPFPDIRETVNKLMISHLNRSETAFFRNHVKGFIRQTTTALYCSNDVQQNVYSRYTDSVV
jgi:hypothetical protein